MSILRITKKINTMLANFLKTPLSTKDQERLINIYKDHILIHTNPVKIILFGSAAKGEMNTGSDLDFAIICDNEDQVRSYHKSLRMYRPPVVWPVDYLIFDKNFYSAKINHSAIISIIESEGVTLYIRELENVSKTK